MMSGEEYFPVFFVWETDGVVFEMPVGINGFIVTIAPIHIRPGIGRIVDDAEDAAVGERSPCDLPIPCASISALGAKAIRSVVKAAASKEEKKVVVEIQ